MASGYPSALDSLVTTRATSDTIPASDHNDVADAVNKIEAELGLNPATGVGSVAALGALHGDTWAPTGALATNMADRGIAGASVAQTAITATTSLHGGMVLMPGVTYTNINAYCTAAGSGSVTTFWLAVVRLSDRQVLQRTANSTTLPTSGATHTRALQATLTVSSPTPVWIALATQVATTSPSFIGYTNAVGTGWQFVAPIIAGNSSTTPTSTPPTVSTVLGAPAAGNASRIYFWLT